MPGFSYICNMTYEAGIYSYELDFSGIEPIRKEPDGNYYSLSSLLKRDSAELRFIRVFEDEGAVVFFYTFAAGKHIPHRIVIQFDTVFNIDSYSSRRNYTDMIVCVTESGEVKCKELVAPEVPYFDHPQ